MISKLLPAEPRRRAPVGRAEDHEYAPPSPGRRHSNGSSVPANVRAVGNAGKRRSPGERDENLAWRRQRSTGPSRALAVIGAIERELPSAVEIEPLRPLEVRTRVLRQRH